MLTLVFAIKSSLALDLSGAVQQTFPEPLTDVTQAMRQISVGAIEVSVGTVALLNAVAFKHGNRVFHALSVAESKFPNDPRLGKYKNAEIDYARASYFEDLYQGKDDNFNRLRRERAWAKGIFFVPILVDGALRLGVSSMAARDPGITPLGTLAAKGIENTATRLGVGQTKGEGQ